MESERTPKAAVPHDYEHVTMHIKLSRKLVIEDPSSVDGQFDSGLGADEAGACAEETREIIDLTRLVDSLDVNREMIGITGALRTGDGEGAMGVIIGEDATLKDN